MVVSKVKKGSILIFSLLILSLILITSLGIAGNVLTQRKATIATSNSTAALQNADRGVEIFLQSVYHDHKGIERLDDLVASGSRLQSMGFVCADGRLKSTSLNLEIIPYVRLIDPPPFPATQSVETTDCDTQMGDIARFRIVGERKGAARALQVTMQDSTKRGLLAHWDFEDNAEALRLAASFPGSPVAKDQSRNDHQLTLCPIDNNSVPAPFDLCPQVDADDRVDPTQDHKTIYFDHDSDDVSTWTDSEDGAVDVDFSGQIGYTEHSQGLEFNGVSNYLALNTQTSGPNSVDPTAVSLSPSSAIALSIWVKRNGSGGGVLVSNGTIPPRNSANDKGYALYFSADSRINFIVDRAGAGARINAPYPNDNSWHHIVAMWDKDDVDIPRIYIDGTRRSALSATQRMSNEIEYDANESFFVGGYYAGGNIDLFEMDEFGVGFAAAAGLNATLRQNYAAFDGTLDDLRIFERALTDNEIKILCHEASDAIEGQCAN